MKDNSEKFAHTVPLGTAVRFTLRNLLLVISFKNRIVIYNRLNDLIQRFTQIFGTFLGNPCHPCSKLPGLIYNRIGSGITDKLIWVVELINTSDLCHD